MDPGMVRALRGEGRDLVTEAGTRRALPPVLHVGRPGGERVVVPHSWGEDAGLRADLVVRALDGLERTEGACGWLTRSGELTPGDADVEWYAAARAGFARHGLPLPWFFVLNRTGWVDLVGGERHAWSRVRASRRPRVRQRHAWDED